MNLTNQSKKLSSKIHLCTAIWMEMYNIGMIFLKHYTASLITDTLQKCLDQSLDGIEIHLHAEFLPAVFLQSTACCHSQTFLHVSQSIDIADFKQCNILDGTRLIISHTLQQTRQNGIPYIFVILTHRSCQLDNVLVRHDCILDFLFPNQRIGNRFIVAQIRKHISVFSAQLLAAVQRSDSGRHLRHCTWQTVISQNADDFLCDIGLDCQIHSIAPNC